MKMLVLTPISHLSEVMEQLEASFGLIFAEDKELVEIGPELAGVEVVLTAPNRAKFLIDKEFLGQASSLRAVVTASTGTNHIDISEAATRGIDVVSLLHPERRHELSDITSTAEFALGLAVAATRDIVPAANSMTTTWDYTRFKGRQIRDLTIGIVGLGRLGTMFAEFASPLAGRILYYDPFVESDRPEKLDNLLDLFRESDIISIHASLTAETMGMINSDCFSVARPGLILVNTARGEIVNEKDLLEFLKANPGARAALDVIPFEERGVLLPELLEFAGQSNQLVLTPHMGGTALDAQEIAYKAALDALETLLNQRAK